MKKIRLNPAGSSLSPAIVAVGVGAIGSAAVPGAAEAHCGHGMWGSWEISWNTRMTDSGCIGKGAQPWPYYDCWDWNPLYGCIAGTECYNCYSPC
jgi:hypothetical protein